MKKDEFVKEITNIDEDFAQWYTDVVRKAELADYTDTKGLYCDKAIWICHMGKYSKLCG